MLGLSQVLGFAALHAMFAHAGLALHVRDVRMWAVAGPLLIVALIVTYERRRRSETASDYEAVARDGPAGDRGRVMGTST